MSRRTYQNAEVTTQAEFCTKTSGSEERCSRPLQLRAKIVKIRPRAVMLCRDEPAIMAWELMNEPRCSGDFSASKLQHWIERSAEFLKSVDPNHLVTVGTEGFFGSSTRGKLLLLCLAASELQPTLQLRQGPTQFSAAFDIYLHTSSGSIPVSQTMHCPKGLRHPWHACRGLPNALLCSSSQRIFG